jgi:NADH dehydrogenase/NADH:ubiquinone oxidoreductase subunit G
MKTKFKRIKLYKLHVGELYSFLLIVHEALLKVPTPTPRLKQQTDELGALLAELKKAMNAGDFKSESDAVKNADRKRNDRFISFRLLLESASYSDTPAIEEMANSLLKALKEQGKNITQLSLKKETAAIHSLNELFTTNPRYVDSLAGLKLKENWDGVWSAQQNFESRYGYRNGVKMEEKLDAAAYEVGKSAKSKCMSIFEYIEDLNHIEEKPEYLAMMVKVNGEIEATMAVVKARETLAAKKKKEEEEKKKKQ